MLILVDNLQVHLLSKCAYYPGAKPGKKHALNKQYALNSELHLLTRVYGMLRDLGYKKSWLQVNTFKTIIMKCSSSYIRRWA